MSMSSSLWCIYFCSLSCCNIEDDWSPNVFFCILLLFLIYEVAKLLSRLFWWVISGSLDENFTRLNTSMCLLIILTVTLLRRMLRQCQLAVKSSNWWNIDADIHLLQPFTVATGKPQSRVLKAVCSAANSLSATKIYCRLVKLNKHGGHDTIGYKQVSRHINQ